MTNLTEKEIWKRMPEFDNEYEVSNLGRFRSVDRIIIRKGSEAHIKGRIIKGQQDAQGYVAMTIKNKQEKAHRLVAKYFVENPLNKKEVNHKNGIKNDNRASNLEWCSHEENMKHLYTKMPFEHKNTKQKRLERDNLIKKLSSFLSCSTIEEVKDCWVSSKNLLNMLNVKIEYIEVPKFYSEYQQLLSDQLAKNEGVEINAELEAENTKLKEVLKNIRKEIAWTPRKVTPMEFQMVSKIVSWINQALGEE